MDREFQKYSNKKEAEWETKTELQEGKTRYTNSKDESLTMGKGRAGKESGSFMSLCDDRPCVTTGHSVSLCLIPPERLTLTQGQGLSPASALSHVHQYHVCVHAGVSIPSCVMLAVAPVSLCASVCVVCETSRVCAHVF